MLDIFNYFYTLVSLKFGVSVKIIILDTETSGSTLEDRVISMAIGEYHNGQLINRKKGMFNPGVAVKQGSFWVHKISDEKLANKPTFKNTEFFPYLESVFSSPENVVVGHAICNDLFMIAREGIQCKCRLIDTQYCSVEILKTKKTALNFLAKEFSLVDEAEKEGVKFHTAEGDVYVTYLLLNELLKHNTFNQLIQLSMKPFYEILLSGDGYRKQRVYHLATKDKEILMAHYNKVKDQKVFYALMYFYGNADLFSGETKKARILKILN